MGRFRVVDAGEAINGRKVSARVTRTIKHQVLIGYIAGCPAIISFNSSLDGGWFTDHMNRAPFFFQISF